MREIDSADAYETALIGEDDGLGALPRPRERWVT